MITFILVNPVDDKKDLMMILNISNIFFGTKYIFERHLAHLYHEVAAHFSDQQILFSE